MKAELVLFEAGEKASGEKNTYEDFEKTFCTPEMSWIFEAMKEYARIQIEKDRISETDLMVIVKSESKNYHQSERTSFLEGAETVLRQLRHRQIILD